MRLKSMGWVILVITLMICSACMQSSASVAMTDAVALSNSNSAGTDSPPLYCEKTQLHWEVPQCEYRIVDTVAGKNSYAVLYVEKRPDDDKPKEYRQLVMAQIFDEQGNHERTAYAEVWTGKGDELSLKVLHLTNGKLYYASEEEDDYHYSMETTTGYVNKWRYETLVKDGGAVLAYSSDFRETPYTLGMRFCLTDTEGKVSEIVIPEYDHNFGMALDFLINPEYVDREGITYEATVTLDAVAKTAEVTNTKLTYTLDFNDLSYTCTRRYTDEMIEELLATSPDGKRALYYADGGGAGDAFWRDIVLKRYDGSISLLNACSLLYGVDFFNNDVVVLNEVDSLTAYDITGEQPVGQLLMDLGSITEADGDTHTERLIVGMAVDHKNQLLLAATRNYTEDWDSLMPVTLVVFDASLKQIKELKTDCQIRPYRNNWTMPCDIAINGDGTANLSWREEPPVQVQYLV